MVDGVGVLASPSVPARIQMGSTLGFHIVLACFGIALPTVVLIAHWIGIRRNDPSALLLARRWSKVMALLFSVGAVTGTVLSYEMGLLWPGLMGRFGAAIGIPFSIEAVFFFLEGVFIGVYLYGWRRLSPWAHWWSGVPLIPAGVLGAVSVVAANSWMNQPQGFTIRDGRLGEVDPFAVFFNRATSYEVPHMVLAAYMVTGFVWASVYAVGMLRGRTDRYHRLGFVIPFTVAAIFTPLQVSLGDKVARYVAYQQPVKFAAMELVPHTGPGITEWFGGIYLNGRVFFGIGVPYLDSILKGFSPDTVVIGWDSVPPDERPPLVNLIHWAFDTMVGLGFALLALAAWLAWHWWFHRDVPRTRWFLIPAAASGVASTVALISGWIVTEVGRQPWIVYRIMRVSDAVTTASGVSVTLGVIYGVYTVMTVLAIGGPWVMSRRWRRETPDAEDQQSVPYGPTPAASSQQER